MVRIWIYSKDWRKLIKHRLMIKSSIHISFAYLIRGLEFEYISGANLWVSSFYA